MTTSALWKRVRLERRFQLKDEEGVTENIQGTVMTN